MHIKSILLAAGVSIALAAAASATTFTFTEGDGSNRALVAGSVDLEDASSGSPGFNLNASNGNNLFTADDTLQIHGRIVSATDTFSYSFTSTTAINIGFDFDGYALDAGGSVAAGFSGLINQNVVDGSADISVGGKGVNISLFDATTNALIGSKDFTTNVVSTTEDFGLIFGNVNVAGGSYRLVVDGSGGPKAGTAALYDLKVAAVPLPAPALLLLAGLGGLVVARRRKSA